jgi:hypothetical protein
MKKFTKKNYIFMFIGVAIIVSFVLFNNYKKPIDIHIVFNDAVIRKSNSNEGLKDTTIEINAKIYRGIYRGSILNFTARLTNQLEGKITVDNKEYYFDGFTAQSELINILGSVYENSEKAQEVFMLRMEDLDSIELIGKETNEYDYKVVAKNKK